MSIFRREFLKLAYAGSAGAAGAILIPGARAQLAAVPGPVPQPGAFFLDVRRYGATADGHTIDSFAINRAIDAASAAGGGTVYFPAGTYACFSIRLKSNVVLSLDQGATILAADPPAGGGAGYDEPEPKTAYDAYQDYGHNHWHNSLIWGEGVQNVAITGTGLIWGKGLIRSERSQVAGSGNKAIALKNCHNIVLKDFSILKGGWFGILATGVDNLTIDNLKIDTDRDGMDIDCCRNVRVSNCSVNSPWDDGICPKSSFALGHARATVNLTITNCYVTGAYQLGSMLDGSWKRWENDPKMTSPTGRIKCGTESNGGFKNITISNCVFDGCRGFALESVDGALLEDITFTGVTMRDCTNVPLFLRLGARMRGPEGTPVGTLRRVIISNVVSYNSVSRLSGGGIIAGIADHPIEDVKIHDLYFEHRGGGTKEQAALVPDEKEKTYPEPTMFGDIPASGFYVRNVKNIEFSNVQVAWSQPDARPVFSLNNVAGADLFRVKSPRGPDTTLYTLNKVSDFRLAFSPNAKDTVIDPSE